MSLERERDGSQLRSSKQSPSASAKNRDSTTRCLIAPVTVCSGKEERRAPAVPFGNPDKLRAEMIRLEAEQVVLARRLELDLELEPRGESPAGDGRSCT